MSKLYNDARVQGEYATKRLWQYLLRAPFPEKEWVISSEQPPSYTARPELKRRVDLVVEHMDLSGQPQTKVLFMELKKHNAPEQDIRECESQCFDAAFTFNVWDRQNKPHRSIWLQACIGTTTRFWVYNTDQESAEGSFPFLPGAFGLQGHDGYIDVHEHSALILEAYSYIRSHKVPPSKFLVFTAPSLSPEQEPPPPLPETASSSAPQVMDMSDVQGQIPLAQNLWLYVEVYKKEGDKINVRTQSGTRIRTDSSRWIQQFRQEGNLARPCFAYIGKDGVYWTWNL